MSNETKIPERTIRNCAGFLVINPAWTHWADDRIASLEAQLAEARKDVGRLDWLVERGVAWRGCYDETWLEGEWIYREHDPRQEIDNEMKGQNA